jgi:hypothetical protein
LPVRAPAGDSPFEPFFFASLLAAVMATPVCLKLEGGQPVKKEFKRLPFERNTPEIKKV